MLRLWPLFGLALILLGSGLRLLSLDREIVRAEEGRTAGDRADDEPSATLLLSFARLIPKALSRIAHFSGAALGLVALSRSVADQGSPLLGVGCLGLGSLSALAISAWGRRMEGRVRALNRTARSEMRGKGGKV